MKPNFERFDPTRVGDSVASLKGGLLKPFQKVHDFLRQYGANGFTLEDNFRATVMTLPLVHGVEYPFDRPKSLPYPKWCRALESLNTDGSLALPVTLQLNKRRTDGRLGITARYDAGAASTGFAGEQSRSFVAQGAAVGTWTTNIPQTITSIPLGAGEWDVSMVCIWDSAAITGTSFAAAIHSAGNAMPAGATAEGDNLVQTPTMPTANAASTLVIPQFHVSLAAAATRFLCARLNFTAGTPGVYGRISAVRSQPYLTGYSANVTFSLGDV